MRAGLPQREPLLLQRWDGDRPLRAAARGGEGPAALRAARRAALRQRQHPYRARAQQDPEGPRGALAADARPRLELRAGLGLPRPADRMEDRGGIPRQGQGQGRGRRSSSSAANAAPSRSSWIDVQREEFKRLGVEGDWDHPYATMALPGRGADRPRDHERSRSSDQLYRGSKPVMWSSVEKTALAEAEVEYHEKTSPTVWVKFPIVDTLDGDLDGASVVIWTTTPWTIPANRADRLRLRASHTASIASPTRRPTTGPRPATAMCSPTSSPPRCSRPRG